jgi:hypothetical protein
MEYFLRKEVMGQPPQVAISEPDFAASKNARNVLVAGFAIEEKYEVLIASYVEFERKILDASVWSMVRNFVGYYDFFELRLAMNICLINLLTSARMYVDQLPRHVKECVPRRRAKALFSTEHDAHPEYRLMEALRNHVQHHGLPVHSASLGSRWTGIKADEFVEFSLEVAVLRSLLEENDKFNAKVLAEMPPNVDLKVATRRYLESLSNVHAGVRGLIEASIDNARRTLEDAHKRYGESYDGSLVGLIACKFDGKKYIETVPLLLDWDDVRIKLQQKNSRLTNLAKRYVSGKSEKGQA